MIISKFFFYLDICHPFLLRIQLKLFFELNFFILFPLEILIANTNFSFHGSLIYILYFIISYHIISYHIILYRILLYFILINFILFSDSNFNFFYSFLFRISRMSVPESDVSFFWDSTLNSTYDEKCTINKATPMTPTERACAASHLKVWRTIAEMRDTLFNTASSSSFSSSSLSSSGEIIIGEVKGKGKEKEGDEEENKLRLIEISRGCFRLSRLGGGWVPLSSSIGRSSVEDIKDKKGQRNRQAIPISAMKTNDNINNVNNGFDDWYLILEDDAEITNNAMLEGLQLTINKIIQQKLPNDFDICYLGHVLPNNCHKTYFRGGEVIKVNYAWCLHSYILRGKAINTLLTNLPINSPVDNFIGQLLFDGIIQVTLIIIILLLFF